MKEITVITTVQITHIFKKKLGDITPDDLEGGLEQYKNFVKECFVEDIEYSVSPDDVNVLSVQVFEADVKEKEVEHD